MNHYFSCQSFTHKFAWFTNRLLFLWFTGVISWKQYLLNLLLWRKKNVIYHFTSHLWLQINCLFWILNEDNGSNKVNDSRETFHFVLYAVSQSNELNAVKIIIHSYLFTNNISELLRCKKTERNIDNYFNLYGKLEG